MPRRKSCGEEELVGGEEEERPQRNAANARERARMRVLSRAFCRLKTTLPWVPPDTKLSKLDTLRLATSYIAHLRAVLHSGHSPPHTPNMHTLNWPFTFQQPTMNSGVQQSVQHHDEMSHHYPIQEYSFTDSIAQIG